MSEYISLLISLSQGYSLLKVALKVKSSVISEDVWMNWADPQSRMLLAQQLPKHCQDYPIVEVIPIFEVEDKSI